MIMGYNNAIGSYSINHQQWDVWKANIHTQ